MRAMTQVAATVLGVALLAAFSACEKRTDELRIDSVEPPQGVNAGGDQVTIKGRGFQPGKTQAEVRFGLRKAENVIIASDREIVVVTPPGDPGPSDVSIMFDDGRVFKIPEGFRFVSPQNQGSVRKAWEKQAEAPKPATP